MSMDKIPNWSELTPEQQEALKKVEKSARKSGAWLGVRLSLLFVASNFVIILVNHLIAGDNSMFGFFAGFINALFLFDYFRKSLVAEHDRIRKEIEKIFE